MSGSALISALAVGVGAFAARVSWVPRRWNAEADALATRALKA